MMLNNEPLQKSVLMIFVKNPVAGKVKTRLAQSVGEEQALAIYKKLLQVTRSVTAPLQVHKQVWYSDFIDDEDMWSVEEGKQDRVGSTSVYEKRLQRGGSLGGRMKKAFREAFDDGFQKVVVIGSDCSTLSVDIIKDAFRLLESQQTVIGPARDGGYYLVGMSKFYPALFDGKSWSTPSVCKATINQLKQWEVSYGLLPVLNDIDTEADLKASKQLQS